MIYDTTSNLQKDLREISNRLQTLCSQRSYISDGGAAERERILEKKEATKQCLITRAKASKQVHRARTNVFKDVSAAEDAHQVIVATLGDLISAKRVTARIGATQWLGQTSDATLQRLSQNTGLGCAATDG